MRHDTIDIARAPVAPPSVPRRLPPAATLVLGLRMAGLLAIFIALDAGVPASAWTTRATLVGVLLLLATRCARRPPRADVARPKPEVPQIPASLMRELGAQTELRSLADVLSARLEPYGVHHVALWIRDDAEATYRLIGGGPGASAVAVPVARAIDAWVGEAGCDPAASWIADPSGPGAAIVRALGGATCLPLRVQQKPLGVLVLGAGPAGRVRREDEAAWLVSLAHHVALAADHARLYEALQRSNAMLSDTKRMLQRASRLSSVGTLAAGLVHEIRNPLAAVQTFLQILPDRLDDPEITVDFREVALSEISRVTQMIGELLGLARMQASPSAATDLEDVVDQVLRLLRVSAADKQVELCRDGGALPRAEADPARLTQALLNLVMNAIEATAPGSRVTVGTRTCIDAEGRPQAELSVSDQGPGVPEAERATIFDPFFTTKEGGTGLGLAVTQQIVDDHGGRLRLESCEGAGATFTVQLPLSPDHRPRAAAG